MSDMKWQLIETAPKDGTIISLNHIEYDKPILGQWEDGEWRPHQMNFVFGGARDVPDPSHWKPLNRRRDDQKEVAEELQMSPGEARALLVRWGCAIIQKTARTWRVERSDYNAAIDRTKDESLEQPRLQLLQSDYIKGNHDVDLPDILKTRSERRGT